MKYSVSIKSIVFSVLALTFVAALPANKAAAQLWGWGSSSVEGKHVVSFKSRHRPGSLVVSFGDRRLYYVMKGNKAISYPIAIPKGDARWQGNFKVTAKKVNPTWTPTADMRRENPKLPASVPGGHPKNPLGVRALYVGDTLYRIHGTDAPWLIGDAVSHGCVRMFNKDVVDLYDRVPVGTPIVVTWNKFRTKSVGYASNGGSAKRANFSRDVFNLPF
jgi:lipoprotein-anchoring transpeptidase ErfK/SrfK